MTRACFLRWSAPCATAPTSRSARGTRAVARLPVGRAPRRALSTRRLLVRAHDVAAAGSRRDVRLPRVPRRRAAPDRPRVRRGERLRLPDRDGVPRRAQPAAPSPRYPSRSTTVRRVSRSCRWRSSWKHSRSSPDGACATGLAASCRPWPSPPASPRCGRQAATPHPRPRDGADRTPRPVTAKRLGTAASTLTHHDQGRIPRAARHVRGGGAPHPGRPRGRRGRAVPRRPARDHRGRATRGRRRDRAHRELDRGLDQRHPRHARLRHRPPGAARGRPSRLAQPLRAQGHEALRDHHGRLAPEPTGPGAHVVGQAPPGCDRGGGQLHRRGRAPGGAVEAQGHGVDRHQAGGQARRPARARRATSRTTPTT